MTPLVQTMPAFEAAPWPQYEREAAVDYRRGKLAVAVTAGLMVAFAHAERPQNRPDRRDFERHQNDVQTMAAIARRALGNNPAWSGEGLFETWLGTRVVSWAEVEAELGHEIRGVL